MNDCVNLNATITLKEPFKRKLTLPLKKQLPCNTTDLTKVLRKLRPNINYCLNLKEKCPNYNPSPKTINSINLNSSMQTTQLLPNLTTNLNTPKVATTDEKFGSCRRRSKPTPFQLYFTPEKIVQKHPNESHSTQRYNTRNTKIHINATQDSTQNSIFDQLMRNIYVSPIHIRKQIYKSKQLSAKVTKLDQVMSRNKNIALFQTDATLSSYAVMHEIPQLHGGSSITPCQATVHYRKHLAEYEVEEISNYKEIYYIGNLQSKLHILKENDRNFGWDNPKGFYIVKAHDHVGYRYEVVSLIGKGSFGQVYRCIDHKTKQVCAIKILRNKKKFHMQGQIEIQILNMLNNSNSLEKNGIVRLIDSFTFRNHIVMAFEMLSIDLFELLKTSKFSVF